MRVPRNCINTSGIVCFKLFNISEFSKRTLNPVCWDQIILTKMKIHCLLSVPIMILIGILTVDCKILECKEKVADIIFALDSSDSIWPSDFTKQVNFVEKVVSAFTIGPNNIRVGAVTFGTRIKPNFYLKDFTDKKTLLSAINKIDIIGGGTNTGATIKYIREEMFKTEHGSRPWAAKIVVLITDGFSLRPKDTMMEASIAHSYDIEIFAIGVGGGVDPMELDSIASEPVEKHIFRVGNYKALNHIKHSFTETTCDVLVGDQTPVEKPVIGDPDHPTDSCGGKPAEVYFVLDSSNSIWEPDFKKQLDFVRDVVRMFDLGQEKTRVGVVTYSDGVHPMIPLDAYDMEEFDAKMKKIPYLMGGTSTDSAIRYIRKTAFSADHVRPDVAHIAIVITDGQSSSFKRTVDEAKSAHRQGIQMFAIGVGKDVDEKEMMEIASDPDENYVFRVNGYNTLKKIESLLAVKTCEVPAPKVLSDQSGCSINHLTDLIFVMDSSSLSHHNTQIASKAIARITSSFPKTLDLKSGIVKEKDPTDGYLSLNYYHKTNWFINRLRKDKAAGLQPLLHHVRRHSFREISGSRRDSEKILVIFIDSELLNSNKSVLEAMRLKFQNVKIYVVAIGSTVSEKEAGKIATFPAEHYVIRFTTFQDMLTESNSIMTSICQGH